jgi:hypothetical protein
MNGRVSELYVIECLLHSDEVGIFKEIEIKFAGNVFALLADDESSGFPGFMRVSHPVLLMFHA